MKKKWMGTFEIVLLSLIGFFLSLFIVSLIVRNNVDASEWWSRNISRWYLGIVSSFSAVFPFSLMECYFIILAILVVTFLVFLIINLTKKEWRKSIQKVGLITVLVFGTISTYKFICSPMYGRKELPLNYYENSVNQKEFVDIVHFFDNDFSYCASQLEFKEDGEIVSPYSFVELGQRIEHEFNKIDNDYFASNTSRHKPMASSFIYRELQITGVSFAITGEANINYLTDNASMPFTMAHELAHQKGVMREDEANQTALYVCLNSDDPYIRFSAYSNCYYSLQDLLNYTGKEEDKTLYYELDEKIWKNWNFNYQYWSNHNLFEKIGDFFNNLYLKDNGTEGTSTYIDSYKEPPTDSGEKGNEGETIYNISFTPYQKLFFTYYYLNN